MTGAEWNLERKKGAKIVTPSTSKGRARDLKPVVSRKSAAQPPEIRVYAWARTTDSKTWRKVIRFADHDGRKHQVLLSDAELMNARDVWRELADNGFRVPVQLKERKAIVDNLLTANPGRRALLVQRPGWYGRQFLLGDRKIRRQGKKVILGDQLGDHVARCAQAGTAEQWAEVAMLALNSSYVLFALCLGFAAPLLSLSEIEGGGIHFFGRSSKGKTTLQCAAASIFGRGRRSGGYVRSWKVTDSAAEELLLGHCDLPLVLDELKLLHRDTAEAARRATDFVYVAASGTGKARSSRYTGLIPEELRAYRALVISSGEWSLGGQARAGGTRRLEGEEARLVDVPVPNTATGIFDRLPEGASGADSRAAAEAIERVAGSHYGVVGVRFLEHLTDDIASGEQDLKTRLEGWMGDFSTAAKVDRANGYDVRFARLFGLAYAAGLLAIHYGLVPWKRTQVLVRIKKCYRRAARLRQRAETDLAAALSGVRGKIAAGRDVLDCTGDAPDAERVLEATALRVKFFDGDPIIAVRSDGLARWTGLAMSAKEIARLLAQEGWLVPGSHGKRTRQISVPGVKSRRRYYCLRLPESPE